MLLHNLIGNASLLELLWTGNALFGLFLSIRNWRSALVDFTVLGGVTNGRRAIAIGTLVVEALISAKFCLYILVGAVAMNLPAGGDTVIATLIGLVLLASSLMLTTISVVNRRVSDYLLKYGMHARGADGRFVKDGTN